MIGPGSDKNDNDLLLTVFSPCCRIFKGRQLVSDSGNVFDSTLRGGRLGAFCFSQERVIWSDLSYMCREGVPRQIYDELPQSIQGQVLFSMVFILKFIFEN